MSLIHPLRARIGAIGAGGASGSRAFGAGAVLGAAAKGKPAKSPAPKKKAASFAKPRTAGPPGSGGSGGGGGGSKRAERQLAFSLAADPPDLGDLPVLHAESFRPSSAGRPAIIPPSTVEQLRVCGPPKAVIKQLADVGGATTILRGASVDMARRLDGQKGKGSASARYLLGAETSLYMLMIAGPAGVGKSTILLQSVVYASQSGWIVFYVPKVSEWTSSIHPFSYDPQTKSFAQPSLSAALLDQLVAVNGRLLSSISLSDALSLRSGETVAKGTTIPELIRAHKGTSPVEVLEGVLSALAAQTTIPILVALDEVQSLFDASSYRTPDNAVIQSYDLSVPRLFLEYLTGRKALSSGAVLTSLSHLPRPPTPTLSSALSLPTTHPLTPYTPLSPTHLQNASSNLSKIDIPPLSTDEAKGMFELLSLRGRARGGDASFLNSFIASGGNTAEFSRGVARSLGTM